MRMFPGGTMAIIIPFASSVVLEVLYDSSIPLWSLKPNIIYKTSHKTQVLLHVYLLYPLTSMNISYS